MKVTIETMLCLWDEEVANVFAQMINIILLSMSEKEVRESLEILKSKIPLDRNFALHYQDTCLEVYQRKLSKPQNILKNRLLVVEF